MTHSTSTTAAIEQLLVDVTDVHASKILQALCKLAEGLDEVKLAQAAMHQQLEQLVRGSSAAGEPSGGSKANYRGNTATAPWLQPPLFKAEISEYEAGMLFADSVGFDLTLAFADAQAWEWYRIWGFNDAGHVLHVLLEACARTECTADVEKFTYRRDDSSATVYAIERPALERLLSRFLQLGESDEGTLQLIERMNIGLSD